MADRPDARTWTDLDQAEAPEAFAQYLDTVRQMQAAAAYKQRSLELARPAPGMRAVDVGCGTGDDAARLAELVGPEGAVLGLDFSQAMVDEAQKRWAGGGLALQFRVGDIRALDLDDDSVHIARADRVLQHLQEPGAAVDELIRVTRPGGRVVVADPDWGTYIIDTPRDEAAQRYHAFAAGQATTPWSGRMLYGLLRARGLAEVTVEAHVATFLDYGVLERMGNLDAGFVAAVEAGAMNEAEVRALKEALLQRQAEGRFFAALTVFTAAGTVPG
ncbi:MAG: methyltransferase domain-containing protein [Alphaproteobacteria bacterium]|nr:methyltransferase domain-containing protein [Alphaproteobacteria bacterium]MCB9794435.1 methyltransferase domain-containing protein [Alphaproteobacteria bacterium]